MKKCGISNGRHNVWSFFFVFVESGTNIYVANGAAAGQAVGHVLVHIIPRFEGDKVVIPWAGKEIKEKEMKKIASDIRKKVVKKEGGGIS